MSSPTAPQNPSESTLRPYEQMISKTPEGITFLFSPRLSDSIAPTVHKLAMQYHLPAGSVTEEFRRLIAIKAFTADEDGTKIMPTDLMDELWIAAIVDTQMYAELQTALGIKLHRRYGISEPPGGDQEARALSLSTMKCLYKNFFNSEPLTPADPLVPQDFMTSRTPAGDEPEPRPQNVKLNIMLWWGDKYQMSTSVDNSIGILKENIAPVASIPAEQQQLVCAGKEQDGVLLDGKTLEQYGFVDGDMIYLVEK